MYCSAGCDIEASMGCSDVEQYCTVLYCRDECHKEASVGDGDWREGGSCDVMVSHRSFCG